MGLEREVNVLSFRAVRTWKAWLAPVAAVAWLGCLDVASVTGGSSDAGSDSGGSSSDSGPASDSGSNADSSGSSGGPFCASISPTPTLCDDFDEANSAGFPNWDAPNVSSGTGTVALASLAFSKPNSMVANTTSLAQYAYGQADLSKSFSNYAGHALLVTLTYEMNVQTWDTNVGGEIFATGLVFVNSGPEYHQVVLNLISTGGGVSAQIAENATGVDGGVIGYQKHPISQHPMTSGWQKIEIDYSIPAYNGSSGNVVTVKFDGTTVLGSDPLTVPFSAGTPVVHLGIGSVSTSNGSASPWSVNYDNVLVNITSM
jgi:hypothetical protein